MKLKKLLVGKNTHKKELLLKNQGWQKVIVFYIQTHAHACTHRHTGT